MTTISSRKAETIFLGGKLGGSSVEEAAMRVYFATNRKPNRKRNPNGFTDELAGSNPALLRFGYADFAEDFSDYELTIADEKIQNRPPDKQRLGSETVFEAIRGEMRERAADALIYVHGFDFSFDEAIRRTAELARTYDEAALVPVLFTWPSDGTLIPWLSYYSDRDDAKASAPALSRGLRKLAHYMRRLTEDGARCEQSVHVLVHSMGGYAFAHAVEAIAAEGRKSVRRLWQQVILAAPDEDEDAFQAGKRLADLDAFCKRVTLYINPGDRALTASDVTKFLPNRLGAEGPTNARDLPDKIEIVDCEAVADGDKDVTLHQYYRLDQPVIDDIVGVLKGTPAAALANRTKPAGKRRYKLTAS